MKNAVKTIFALLCAADALFLYMTIGYIMRAARGATLVGSENAHFIGYYMLAAPFALVFLVFTVVTVVVFCKFIKKR